MYPNEVAAQAQRDAKIAYTQGLSGAGMLGGEGVQRRPEMSIQMDKLGSAIGYAEDSLNELEKRLEHVLRPALPESTSAGSQIMPAPPMSPYAQGMGVQVGRAGRIGERIQDLLRRLEV